MKYKAYLFDLDGTLLDTLADLAVSVNYALEAHQLPLRTETEVRRFLGNGVERLIADAVPPQTPEKCYKEVLQTFRTYYLEHCMDHTAPYPGIMSLLQALKSEGAKLYVISNKPDNAVQSLAHRYFKEYMDYAVGESKTVRRKPCPDALLKAIRHAGVSMSEAVYVGDSEVDIETARRAGVDCLSVTWGFRDRDFLVESGATVLIDHPADILCM